MTHRLKDFEPWMGEIESRSVGAIIASETGTAYAYSIDKLQDRGKFFISPMEQVYCGQVIGEHTRSNDITVNVTKAKQLTNMRASGADDTFADPKSSVCLQNAGYCFNHCDWIWDFLGGGLHIFQIPKNHQNHL